MSNADLFLTSFVAIEHDLRKGLQNRQRNRRLGFPDFPFVVRERAEHDSLVELLADELIGFGKLRNVLVHQRGGGEFIAEPSAWAVNRIGEIERQISDPPKIIPAFEGEVHKAAVQDQIGAVLSQMLQHSFSQIPVYDGDTFKDLLTANTITRWLAASISQDLISLSETYVHKVLQCGEDTSGTARKSTPSYRFMSGHATQLEALEAFGDYAKRGQKLEAILITENAKRTQPLLGIITVWDLPKIDASLTRTRYGTQ